jgi:hypothetical protein
MFSILRQPFPSHKNSRQTIGMSLLAGICVFAVFYFVKPFGLNKYPAARVAAIGAQYTGVTIALSLLCSTLLPRLIPSLFNEKHWRVWHEIVFLLGMILIIAAGNIWLTAVIFHSTVSGLFVLNMVKYTLAIGMVPVLLSVLLKQQSLLRKYSREAGQIEQLIASPLTPPLTAEHIATPVETAPAQPAIQPAVTPAMLHIKGDNQPETLQIEAANFLFAEASDNYTSIHYLQNGLPRQVLYRLTLKNLETQVAVAGGIFRCHKSYLVNLPQVAHISGNAQGYKLHLSDAAVEIPVSRSLNATIRQRLASLHGQAA